jgi:hypothetical protein
MEIAVIVIVESRRAALAVVRVDVLAAGDVRHTDLL